MNTAVKKGIRQLHLFDMPTSVSSRHLAQSIFVGMGTRFLVALALSLSVTAAFTTGVLPGDLGISLLEEFMFYFNANLNVGGDYLKYTQRVDKSNCFLVADS